MASLRHVFFRTPGAWAAGIAAEVESNNLYLDGATWTNPDSKVTPAVGSALIAARLSSGQILGLANGGVYAAKPAPPPEEP